MEIIYRNGVSIDYVCKELHYCQEAQSWSHGTRSSWTFELEEILKAARTGNGDAFDAAVTVAEAEACLDGIALTGTVLTLGANE